jgi:hypothetical protein
MRPAQQAVRDAERRFPVRVRIGVLPEGLGSRLDQIVAWLDANFGADGWTSTPSSTGGVVNDALAIYFLDAIIASAFVARSCTAQKVEIVDGVYRVRDDEPTTRVGAACTARLKQQAELSKCPVVAASFRIGTSDRGEPQGRNDHSDHIPQRPKWRRQKDSPNSGLAGDSARFRRHSSGMAEQHFGRAHQ